MERYSTILQQARQHGHFDDNYVEMVTRYLRDGDEKLVEAIKCSSYPFPAYRFESAISPPSQIDEYDRRFLRLVVAKQKVGELRNWLFMVVHREPPGQDVHTPAAAALRQA